MFSVFKKKEKAKLFLGAIVVVPRNEIWKIDERGIFKGANFEDFVRGQLDSLFSLPHVHEYDNFNDSDLALEIIVTQLQGGEFTSAQINPIDIPIFWRPKVKIKARLSFINSKKTKKVFDVSQNMPWRQYFSRVFSVRGIIRFKPLFEAVDLEPILYKACEQLLGKLAKCL